MHTPRHQYASICKKFCNVLSPLDACTSFIFPYHIRNISFLSIISISIIDIAIIIIIIFICYYSSFLGGIRTFIIFGLPRIILVKFVRFFYLCYLVSLSSLKSSSPKLASFIYFMTKRRRSDAALYFFFDINIRCDIAISHLLYDSLVKSNTFEKSNCA